MAAIDAVLGLAEMSSTLLDHPPMEVSSPMEVASSLPCSQPCLFTLSAVLPADTTVLQHTLYLVMAMYS